MSCRRLNTLIMVGIWVAVVAVGLVSPPVAQSATMCEEALARIEQDGFSGDRFTFCILGDTRVPGLAKIFPQNIKEMNLLDPSFIIDVGDLIPGYTGDAILIQRQWDDFLKVTAASRVPLVPVVGNHDVWDWQSRAIYRQRIGPLAFSFSYGNAHFICLDTEEPGHTSNIGPAQLRWLKEDLAAHGDATHIFVFIHQPVWSYPGNWIAKVHPLLKQYPVKAVFAGHEHIYRKDVVDDIPCFVTGGGGAELGDRPPEAGGFYHFLHVSVKANQVRVAVVKTGNIESDDVVTGAVIETGQ